MPERGRKGRSIMAKKETTNKVTMKLHGALKSAYNTQDKDENGNVKKSTNIVNIFLDGLTMEKDDGTVIDGAGVREFFDDFYANTVKKWVPDWYKDEKDFMSVKSAYNIPCKIEDDGKQMSFAEFVERGNIRDAKVIVKVNVKENALYPNAMLIVDEGTPYDAFENF